MSEKLASFTDKAAKMFEFLNEFPAVVVVGPAYSGGVLAARAIAHDTVHPLETPGSPRSFLGSVWRDDCHAVYLTPGATHLAHCLPVDVAVVYMIRHYPDINNAALDGCYDDKDKQLVLDSYMRVLPPGTSMNAADIARMQYHFWKRFQREGIAHWFEVQYSAAASHPVWQNVHGGTV